MDADFTLVGRRDVGQAILIASRKNASALHANLLKIQGFFRSLGFAKGKL